jgi:hypothetical protein
MNCKYCGSELLEGSLFCPSCGSPVEPAAVEPAVPAPEQVSPAATEQAVTFIPTFADNPPQVPPVNSAAQPMIFCGHCGNQVPANASVCTACGLPPTTVVTPPPAPKKKKSHLGLWIFAAIASILVIAVIAGLCTNWFGFYGPGTQISIAAENTLKAGNFTIDLSMSTESDSAYSDGAQKIDGTIKVIINAEDRELMLQAEIESGADPITLAIYNKHLIFGSKDYFMKQDISEALEEFFDSYEATADMDWEELLESIDEDLYDEISDVINFNDLEKCLSAYNRKLNNTKWLKENAGYSFSMEDGVRLHQFKPKNYKFINASLECFEAAFIDEDDYEDLQDQMKDNRSQINSVDIELIVGIKSNKLTSLGCDLEYKKNSINLELEFDKIGETEIDEDELKLLLDKAR